MSLKIMAKVPQLLVFRLTLLYSGIFTVIIILAFVFLYISIKSLFLREMNQNLGDQAAVLPAVIEGLDFKRTELIFKILSENSEKIFFFRIIESHGEIFHSNYFSSKDVPVNETLLDTLRISKGNVFETISIPKHPQKVRVVYRMIGPSRIVQIGRPIMEPTWLYQIFGKTFSINIVFLFLLAGVLGWFMAKQAIMGVDDVTKTALHIYNGQYESRVPVTGRGKEIDDLAITFNKMLERIQALMREMKEITDNIAHDLRSPITRIRGIAEMTIMTAKGSSDYELMAGNIIEDCDRLLGIINMMLDISEAESGISILNKSEFNISSLVEDAYELFKTIANDKNIRINPDFRSSSNIYADEQKLQRVIANLFDNAVKYSSDGSNINFSVYENGDFVNISIKDNGMGISQKDLPHIFKRFYRCDSSRSEEGAGLGLSWAQAIIKAHSGKILVNSKPNEGSTFTVIIPKY